MVNKVSSSFPRLKSEVPGAVGDLPLGNDTGQEAMVSFVNGIGEGEDITIGGGVGVEASVGFGKSVDVRAFAQATRVNSRTTVISERADGFMVSKYPNNEDFTYYYDEYTTR